MRTCYRRVQTWWEQSVQTSSRSKRGRLEQSSGERLLENGRDSLSEQEQQNSSITEEVLGSEGSETTPTSPLGTSSGSPSGSESSEEETEEEEIMAPTTEQEVDALTDAAMRALLKEKIAGTAGRGEKKNTVLFKQEPPYLEEYEDYAMWKVKFTVWQANTAMSDQQQACCVIQGLRDDHKHHKKGLQSAESDEGTAGEARH